MSDLVSIALTVSLGFLMGTIGTYVMAKILTRNIFERQIMPIFDQFIEEITQNPEYQQKIYVVGALVGKGLSDGSGLSKFAGQIPAKGKGGLMGFIQNLIINWVGSKVPALGAVQEATQQTEQPSTVKKAY